MVEYLSGNRIQGSSTLASSPPQTSWKEIGRMKLSSASDTITVKGLSNATSGSLPSKDNYMILFHDTGSNNAGSRMRLRVNEDDNDNYAYRFANNFSTTETPDGTESFIYISESDLEDCGFAVINAHHTSSKESVFHGRSVKKPSGSSIGYGETHGTYTQTGNITSLSMITHTSVGYTWDSDTEMIVLGADNDEADSGTNFWQLLAEETQTTAGETLTATVAKKNYYMLEYWAVPNGNIDIACRIGDGSAASSGYYKRESDDWGAMGTASDSQLPWGKGSGGARYCYGTAFLDNHSGNAHLWISKGIDDGGSGNNYPSNRRAGGWYNGTTDQIDTIQLMDNGQSGNLGVGTVLRIWGAD